jgi:hypothetical protein
MSTAERRWAVRRTAAVLAGAAATCAFCASCESGCCGEHLWITVCPVQPIQNTSGVFLHVEAEACDSGESVRITTLGGRHLVADGVQEAQTCLPLEECEFVELPFVVWPDAQEAVVRVELVWTGASCAEATPAGAASQVSVPGAHVSDAAPDAAGSGGTGGALAVGGAAGPGGQSAAGASAGAGGLMSEGGAGGSGGLGGAPPRSASRTR